jgi:subtilisin family serine protease
LAATLLVLAVPSPALAQVAQPNDPFFPPMAGWQGKIGWDPPADDDTGALIAVVDSGMWSGFDDFAGYLDDESADCVNKPISAARRMEHPTDVEDTVGHGTQVATLAAAPANGKGSVGVSPNSHVLVVRVTTDSTAMTCAFNYLAGVARTTAQLMVVNVSIEFPSVPSRAARVALDRLIGEGALVVAAAGNGNGVPVQWPANASHVLAVGRDDGDGAAGKKLDIVAPGAHMLLPDAAHFGQWSTSAQGTSFAAPIVSGAAARVWGLFAIDDPQGVVYLLRKNAKKIGARFGSGSVNLRAALAAGRQKLPVIQESEPNDLKSSAEGKRGCKRTCTLRGLVTTSDDNSDYWHLIGRSRCPKKLTVSHGVSARCGSGHGGVFVRVRPKIALGLYTVTVPRR